MRTPVWLLRAEAYAPARGGDAFIGRSIRSFLGALARIRARTAGGGAGIDARVGLVSTLLLIVLVSVSHRTAFIGLCGTALLVVLALQRAEAILDVVKAALAAGLFAAAILLPSALWGNPGGAIIISVKVLVCVGAVRLLSATTEWRLLLRAFGAFRVPNVFVLVLDLALRFIVLLDSLALEMLWALRLRSVGRSRDGTRPLSGIVGTLFLKSRALGDQTYAAMECRCFTGSYRAGRMPPLRAVDWAVVAADAGLAACFAFLGI
ncbi:MAG TPA: energy-coupling factor transporter transmembrane component T [Spirochaetia bacterium]